MNNEPKELKPCAHCGAVAKHTKSGTYIVNHVSGCAISLYLGATNHWITGPKAIKAWQTRATPDIVKELVDVLRKASVGSCNCMTKTPNPDYHAESCFYKTIGNVLAKATKIGGVE